ncbi:MAG: tRNA (guanosine(46)-N7)-methyltransferase TrmB [Phycisphaerales bacterium]|nr:tRNA (guanosine(46)-N7)-methyltransferase TrmB [Phycisphaerales bacterium]
MSLSLSHGKTLDVTGYGYTLADLPALPSEPGGPMPYRTGFDPRLWFAEGLRGQPLELEIGSGKGTFLVQHASLLPGVNFIGIEYARAFWKYAADRVRRHQLANVRLFYGEAAMFVRGYVPDGCLRQVHIYFPDPWPKTRHHKRRLVQADFLRELHRVLEPGGAVRLATDHADYFAWMQDHAGQVGDLFICETFEPPRGAGEGELVGSNFERKYRREGRPFHALVLRRR